MNLFTDSREEFQKHDLLLIEWAIEQHKKGKNTQDVKNSYIELCLNVERK